MIKKRVTTRTKLPGFPIPVRKFTKAEIDEYFSGDKIQCLICGYHFKALSGHLELHSMVADDYKERYGLPWRRGLSSATSRERKSQAITRCHEEGTVKKFTPENQKLGQIAIKKYGERSQPFSKEMAINNLPSEPHDPSIINEIIKRVLTGRSIADVCRDEGMPSRGWVHIYFRKNPNEKVKFLEQIDMLSYATQTHIRGGMGPRFMKEVERRRLLGENDFVISKALGVSRTTVNEVGKQKR